MIECVEYGDGVNMALECMTCSTVLMTQDKPEVRCQGCDWTGTEEDMEHVGANIPDLGQRVMPGEPMPAGECPECGALAHVIERWTCPDCGLVWEDGTHACTSPDCHRDADA